MLKLQMVPSGGCDHRWELCCSDWAVCDIPATHPLRKDGHQRLQVRHNDVVMRQTFDCASSLRLKAGGTESLMWLAISPGKRLEYLRLQTCPHGCLV